MATADEDMLVALQQSAPLSYTQQATELEDTLKQFLTRLSVSTLRETLLATKHLSEHVNALQDKQLLCTLYIEALNTKSAMNFLNFLSSAELEDTAKHLQISKEDVTKRISHEKLLKTLSSLPLGIACTDNDIVCMKNEIMIRSIPAFFEKVPLSLLRRQCEELNIKAKQETRKGYIEEFMLTTLKRSYPTPLVQNTENSAPLELIPEPPAVCDIIGQVNGKQLTTSHSRNVIPQLGNCSGKNLDEDRSCADSPAAKGVPSKSGEICDDLDAKEPPSKRQRTSATYMCTKKLEREQMESLISLVGKLTDLYNRDTETETSQTIAILKALQSQMGLLTKATQEHTTDMKLILTKLGAQTSSEEARALHQQIAQQKMEYAEYAEASRNTISGLRSELLATKTQNQKLQKELSEAMNQQAHIQVDTLECIRQQLCNTQQELQQAKDKLVEQEAAVESLRTALQAKSEQLRKLKKLFQTYKSGKFNQARIDFLSRS